MAWAPIVGAAVTGTLGFLGQERTNVQNRQMAREQMAFQERMRNTQWQAAVADMRAAGINPALAYQQGPAAAPGGATAQMGDSISSALQAAQVRKTLQLLDAQVEKAKGEAESAQAQGRLDQWRDNALRRVKMDWDGDGKQEQLIMEMIRDEWLTGRYRRSREGSLSEMSGLGGDAAAAFRPALRAGAQMSSRGLRGITGGLERLERMSSRDLFEAFMRQYRRRRN